MYQTRGRQLAEPPKRPCGKYIRIQRADANLIANTNGQNPNAPTFGTPYGYSPVRVLKAI